MKHKFLLVLFTATWIVASAQEDLFLSSHFVKDSTRSFFLKTGGNYFFSSDAVTNGFASDYYKGSFLTEEMKNNVSANLSSTNFFGGEANWEASLTFHPDTNNRKVEALIAYRSRAHADSRFSEDFFNIFFRGNKMYAGKSANLSNFFYQQYSYRQIVFGIGSAFNLSAKNKLYVGADLAINQGISFMKVTGKKATIYTDPAGEYIDADLHATILTDDSAGQHPSKLDGTGYSGDFYLELETENSLFAVSAENFGSIHWNKWSTQVSIDSTFHFEGIDIDEIFDIEDSIKVTDFSLDSSFNKNFIRSRSEQRIKTNLPAKISASWTLFFNQHKVDATFGADLLLNTYASPRYYAGIGFKISRSSRIGFIMATGGYTDFHAGLNIVHLFPWHMKLELGSNYIYPMVSFKSGKSQGAYLSLSKSF